MMMVPIASIPGTEMSSSVGRGHEISPAQGATARTLIRCWRSEKSGAGKGTLATVRVDLEKSCWTTRILLGRKAVDMLEVI